MKTLKTFAYNLLVFLGAWLCGGILSVATELVLFRFFGITLPSPLGTGLLTLVFLLILHLYYRKKYNISTIKIIIEEKDTHQMNGSADS